MPYTSYCVITKSCLHALPDIGEQKHVGASSLRSMNQHETEHASTFSASDQVPDSKDTGSWRELVSPKYGFAVLGGVNPEGDDANKPGTNQARLHPRRDFEPGKMYSPEVGVGLCPGAFMSFAWAFLMAGYAAFHQPGRLGFVSPA